jgi:hypothetical protein
MQWCDQVRNRQGLWRVLCMESMTSEHSKEDTPTAREETCSAVELDGGPPRL